MSKLVAPGAYARYRPVIVADDLSDLCGPSAGEVELPRRLYWGPDPVFDVSDRNRRGWLYSIVLSEALAASDLACFIDAQLLAADWATLVLPDRVRGAWEQKFPELAA